jgi:hypothetical protein
MICKHEARSFVQNSAPNSNGGRGRSDKKSPKPVPPMPVGLRRAAAKLMQYETTILPKEIVMPWRNHSASDQIRACTPWRRSEKNPMSVVQAHLFHAVIEGDFLTFQRFSNSRGGNST